MSPQPTTSSEAPLCSVIIPCYKAAPLVRFALDSVLAQTFGNWEVVLLEDGTADGTEAIAHEYAERAGAGKVRYVRHPANRGLAEARNTAMREARGKYFAFLDHDDVWNPQHLERAVAELGRGADVAFSAARSFQHETGEVLKRMGPSEAEWSGFPASLFLRNYMAPSATVIRREVFEKLGGFAPGLGGCEDHDYWLRAARAGFKFAFVREEGMRYRLRADQMTNNHYQMHRGATLVALRHWRMKSGPLAARRRHVSELFEQFSDTCYKLRKRREAGQASLQAWLFNPARLRLAARAILWPLGIQRRAAQNVPPPQAGLPGSARP